ncbi:MAG: Na+/H+ antiporter NhaC family protein [Lachnospiraceae bacterium]|nr:Na+/H+ antiporter NhaC family protein [Lachnospiraceae bacterium]
MSTGLFAVIIVAIVIVGAITTRRCTEFLFLGSVLGAMILYGTGMPLKYVEILEEVVGKDDNVWLWLVCGLFGSLIALLEASKGTYGFQKIIEKLCKTEKQTMLASFLLGIVIFIDDYLNVLTVGVCMKKLYDKRKIPRESLAFILDSTGAPVCVLIPVSTWAVFYSKLFYQQEMVSASYGSGMSAYVSAIRYCFYPIVTLTIVLLFCLGLFPKLGAMKKAYQRVAETGKVYSDASKKYNMQENLDADGNVWDFLIPIGLLVAVGIASGEILLGVLVALVACMIMYVPRKKMTMEDFLNLTISGFASMLPTFFMLVGAFSLASVTSKMGLTEFLIHAITPILSKGAFPAVSFLLLSVLAFVTGSNWGMSAVVIPILIPMCQALGGNLVLTMAAIISGGAFGSHACFYTDATVLSSNSAGIDNMEHALTQWPYVFLSAAISTVLFLVFGYAMA